MESGYMCERLVGAMAAEIVNCDRVGRHLIASRDLAAGEIVMQERPLLVTRELKIVDPVTKAFVRLNEVEAVALKLMELVGTGSAEERCLDLLEGASNIPADSVPELWKKHCALCKGVPSGSEELLTRMMGIALENAHGTRDGAMVLCLMGSMMEHSCDPNAFVDFALESENRVMTLRTLVPVACGERISICYVLEYLPTGTRRAMLKRQHEFVCQCSRCTTKPEHVRAFLHGCPSCEEDDCLCSPANPSNECRDLVCDDCGTMFTLDEEAWGKLVDAEECSVISEEMASILHPYHHKFMNMYKANMSELPLEARSQVFGQFADARTRLTGREFDPLVGEYLEMAGDACLAIGEIEDASDKYAFALKCYNICFGDESAQASKVGAKLKQEKLIGC